MEASPQNRQSTRHRAASAAHANHVKQRELVLEVLEAVTDASTKAQGELRTRRCRDAARAAAGITKTTRGLRLALTAKRPRGVDNTLADFYAACDGFQQTFPAGAADSDFGGLLPRIRDARAAIRRVPAIAQLCELVTEDAKQTLDSMRSGSVEEAAAWHLFQQNRIVRTVWMGLVVLFGVAGLGLVIWQVVVLGASAAGGTPTELTAKGGEFSLKTALGGLALVLIAALLLVAWFRTGPAQTESVRPVDTSVERIKPVEAAQLK